MLRVETSEPLVSSMPIQTTRTCLPLTSGDSSMPQSVRSLLLAGLLFTVLSPASAAEREDVRKVINLVTSVKMSFPENLARNRAKTERV